MKIYHFSIVFACFFLAYMFLAEIEMGENEYMRQLSQRTDRVFDKAVDAAVKSLRGYSPEEAELYLSKSIDSFFDSLYADLGIIDSPYQRERLKLYVPFIAVTDDEGVYVWYEDVEDTADGREVVCKRSEKFSYFFYEETAPKGYCATDFLIRFKGKGRAAVYDSSGILGEKNEAYEYYSDSDFMNISRNTRNYKSILDNPEAFEEKRHAVMSQRLESIMEYYCNRHNSNAESMGISYSFSVPAEDGSIYLRAFDGVSFVAFFQGYPIPGTNEVFNCFTVSNAMLREAE